MYFKRSVEKEVLKQSISVFPITLLVASPGVGKSRLIDELFKFENGIDTRDAVFVRLDWDVYDCDTLAERFALGLEHDLPDDIDYRQTIVSAIKDLPAHKLIIVDDIHILQGNLEAQEFLSFVVDQSGAYDSKYQRRWLLASRDIADFPYARWVADQKCNVLSKELALTDADLQALEKALGISQQALSNKSARHIAISYSKIRALKFASGYLTAIDKQNRKKKKDRYNRPTRELLSLLPEELSSAILGCAFTFDLDPELLANKITDVSGVIDFLKLLDLAFFDASIYKWKMDEAFRKCLQVELERESSETILLAVETACELGSKNAFLEQALAMLVKLKKWDELICLLGRYGIDFVDRHVSQEIISRIIRKIPKELADVTPEIQGLKGLFTTLGDQGDTSEGWLRCALENENLKEPFRSKILYRYCMELGRRQREDAGPLLKELLQQLYSHHSGGDSLKALSHSLYAIMVLGVSKERALGHMDLAKKLLHNTEDAFAHARVSFEMGYILADLNEEEVATEFLKKSVEIAKSEGFYDLAARAMTNLQALAYAAHDTPRALHYLRCLRKYAEKSGDSRMKTCTWIGEYWLVVDAGIHDESNIQYQGISRYRATDKYMQEQVRCTIVPATAMLSAESANYPEAIARIEPYAANEDDLVNRASLWAFLALYYSADYAVSPDSHKKAKYVSAIHETLHAIRQMGGEVAQEGDLAFRLLLSLYLMDRHRYLRSFFGYLSGLTNRDHRAPAMRKMLDALLSLSSSDRNVTEFDDAIAELHRVNMGGIARIIRFLPLPLSTQIHIPTPKPSNSYM